MRQPQNRHPRSSRLAIRLVLLVVSLLLLIPLAALYFEGQLPFPPGRNVFPSPVNLQPSFPTISPTSSAPSGDCGSPTLVIGATPFRMQVVQLGADGGVSVPPDTNGTAYWVEGTDLQYIFMLSPTVENLSLVTSLSAGNTARATWSSCTTITFHLSDPMPGDFEITYLPDQSTASIAIYVQLDPTGEGFVVRGESIAE